MVLDTQYIVVIFLVITQHWFEPSIRNAVWNLWPMKCNFPSITFSDICGARHCSWPSVYFHERQAVQHAYTIWQDKMRFKECTGPWFHFSSEGTHDSMSYKRYLGSLLRLLQMMHFRQQVCQGLRLAKCHWNLSQWMELNFKLFHN